MKQDTKLYTQTQISHKLRISKGTLSKWLKKEVETKQETIERLQKQIEEKDKTIADFGQKFAKLADQAQQLNLVDKPRLLHKDKDDEENVSNVNKETETEKQEEKNKKWHWWQFGK